MIKLECSSEEFKDLISGPLNKKDCERYIANVGHFCQNNGFKDVGTFITLNAERFIGSRDYEKLHREFKDSNGWFPK